MNLESILKECNLGKFFITNTNLIVMIEKNEDFITASIVGLKDDDLNNYDDWDIYDWFGQEPSDLTYTRFDANSHPKQKLIMDYTIKYSLEND